MECEAGSVSFPQPLAPCGMGLSAVSWAFSGGRGYRTDKGGKNRHTSSLYWTTQRAEAWLPSHSPASLGRSGFVLAQGIFYHATARPWQKSDFLLWYLSSRS